MKEWNSFWIWLVVFLLIIFLLWLFYGGGDYEFIGLRPLIHPDESILPYLIDHPQYFDQNNGTMEQIEQISQNGIINTTPLYPIPSAFQYRSKGEYICCQSLEEITGKPFRKVRPDFLKNPETGCNLELDGFCEELKIGVEYNGIQHYVYPNPFMRSEEEFWRAVRRDQLKKEKCDQQGVYLITVPYHVPYTEIKEFIVRALPPTLKIEIIPE